MCKGETMLLSAELASELRPWIARSEDEAKGAAWQWQQPVTYIDSSTTDSAGTPR